MKRLLAFACLLGLLSATATSGYTQQNTCRSQGGGGSLAADSISATTSPPIMSPRQISSTGMYLGNNGAVSYLGFDYFTFGGWWYYPATNNLLSVQVRSRTEGVFKKATAQPADCTPNVLPPGQLLHACPHQLVLPDDCSGFTGQDEYARRNWAAPGWYAPLNYGGVTGNFTSPGGDAAWAVPFDRAHDFAGGAFVGGQFAHQAYDAHLSIVSVYPWSTPVRPGRAVLIDSLRHGLTLCNVGSADNMVKAAYSSGGFAGDPNYMDYTWTIFKGGIQSYFEVSNCGYQIFLDDVGSNVYTLGPCPQVLGHVFDAAPADNVVYVESTNNVEMPLAAPQIGAGWIIGGGNDQCQSDSAHGLPPIGENWIPNDNMPAGLMARYRLYDAFLNSQWTYPGTCTPDSQGRLICAGTGQQGSEDWTDVIRNVDQNIVSVGVKDTADANGNQGDAYWSISYYCVQGSMCSGARLQTLFSNIMNATMPSTGVKLVDAMRNWGLAIPPAWPNGPGMPWYIPSAISGGNILSMIAPRNGKNTSNNIEAQQGNYAIIGGIMFNAQPNPPGTPPAPAIADPPPVDAGGYPISTSMDGGFGGVVPGGDAPPGAPVP